MPRSYVIGDVHGCFKTLRRLVEEKIGLTAGDSLYLTGDLIDRGPSSMEVLDYLMMLGEKGYNVRSVLGNHEDMMLKSLDNHDEFSLWMINKGQETLKSFGLMKNTDNVTELIPRKYIDYLRSLPLYIELEDTIIVHAGINFSAGDIFADEHAMLWTRITEYDPVKAGNKIIVHGHTPRPLAMVLRDVANPGARVLNIDAGCAYSEYPGYGNLVALEIGTREVVAVESIF